MKKRLGISALVGVVNFAVVFAVYRLIHFHPAAVPHVDAIYGFLFGVINATAFFAAWPAYKTPPDSN
jgi:hypothetical protein